MANETPVVSMLEDWLICRHTRITGRFVVERVTDWRTGDQLGHAMDFVGATVMGRFTAWPGHLSAAGWPFADAEALDVRTEKTLFYWGYQPLSTELLDRWLSELERYERQG